MTLLTIAQNIANEVGTTTTPSAIAGSTDDTAKRLFSVINAAGKGLMKQYNWQVLRKEQTFVSNGSGSYALGTIVTAGDYDRPVPDTFWDRTDNRQSAVVSPQNWQAEQSGITGGSNALANKIIFRGDNILIDDDTSGNTHVFEYLSENWCQSSGGSSQSAFLADADTGILDEYLLERDALWRYLRVVGDQYFDDREDARTLIERDFALQNAPGKIRPRLDNILIPNIPETGFG